MAITEDMEFPRLTPSDDRYPSSGSLFRVPQDLTDEQFALLAAARAENALTEENLSEFDMILSANPDRLVYAESFRQLRLRHCDDTMEGLYGLMKTTPAARTIRRSLFAILAAAAVITVFLTVRPFAERQTDILQPAAMPELTIVTDKSHNPVVRRAAVQKTASAELLTAPETAKTREPEVAVAATAGKTTPLATSSQAAIPVLASLARSEELRPVKFREITVVPYSGPEENWIAKGIAVLSGAAGKGDRASGSFAIADACIKAINRVLGSEMELKRVMSETGDPVAVSFSSSLLTFSAPVKKTTPPL
jgi:hypothetical protein